MNNNVYFSDFIKNLLPYRWSIFLITSTVVLLTLVYLYFSPLIYQSSATIKIKTENNLQSLSFRDPINDALSQLGVKNIDQEIAILNSFYINNKVISKMEMEVQYFIKKGYKKVEIQNQLPITIHNINIINSEATKKHFIVYPQKDGFKIKEEKGNISEVLPYNKEITVQGFSCMVKKHTNFSKPLYFKLNGNNRDIYESIIKERLKISQPNINVPIIKITYQDNSSQRATNYINTLINVYIAESIKYKNRENNKVLDFIESQLVSTRKKLKKSETMLQEYRVENKVIEPTVQSRILLDRLNQIEIRIEENRIKTNLIDNLFILLNRGEPLESIIPTLNALNENSTIELIQEIQRREQQIKELSIEYTEKYPNLIRLRKETKRDRDKVYYNIKNIQSNIQDNQRNLYEQKRKSELRLEKLPKKEKQLIEFQRDYDVNAKLYDYLLEKQSENHLKQVATISDFEIIDTAYASNRPIKPKKFMLLLVAIILGLILGVFITYLRNFLVKKVQTIQDIQRRTSIPIQGTLPIPSKRDTSSEVLKNPNSELTKKFRKLRTSLQLENHQTTQEGKSILITSTLPNEGKRTILLNLSYLFQLAGHRSILIDLDLYQPTLKRYFKIQSNKGINSYLNHQDQLQDIIFNTGHPYLDVILAGDDISNPSELLLSPNLKELIFSLKHRYDYIFINAAPMVVEETLYLMQFTDTNFIVIRENVTKKSFFNELNRTLAQYRFKNIKLLFSKEAH